MLSCGDDWLHVKRIQTRQGRDIYVHLHAPPLVSKIKTLIRSQRVTLVRLHALSQKSGVTRVHTHSPVVLEARPSLALR